MMGEETGRSRAVLVGTGDLGKELEGGREHGDGQKGREGCRVLILDSLVDLERTNTRLKHARLLPRNP